MSHDFKYSPMKLLVWIKLLYSFFSIVYSQLLKIDINMMENGRNWSLPASSLNVAVKKKKFFLSLVSKEMKVQYH